MTFEEFFENQAARLVQHGLHNVEELKIEMERAFKAGQDSLKPSWGDAPVWADWLTQDFDGHLSWHKHKPVIVKSKHEWDSEGCRSARIKNWKDSLEQRPKCE